MTFTSPTDDIIVQEGTFGYGFTASGNIKAGQGVAIYDDMSVGAPPAATALVKGSIGVAAYDASAGDPVLVYGPGNIVRVIISGASHCSAGDTLMMTSEGKFFAVTDSTFLVSGITATALETQGSANGTARVLLR